MTIIIFSIIIFVVVIVLSVTLGTYFAGSSSNPTPPVPPTPEVVFTDVTFGSLIEDPEIISFIQIGLPQTPEEVKGTIEWGDGEVDTVTASGAISHKYAEAKVYQIHITGPITSLKLRDDTSLIVRVYNINITDSLDFTRADGLTDLGISSRTNFEFPLESQMKCKNVTYLNANYNTADVSFFYTLPLDRLYISEKGITGELPTLPSTLTFLDCYNNQISGTLDVSSSVNLTVLRCYNNQISALDVSGLANLTVLRCYNNQISALDVSGLANLTFLVCSDNEISGTLDVSGLANLEILGCDNNQISALDVSGSVNLTGLFCNNNQISALDVSGLTNLIELFCDNNQISGTLDVSGSVNLTTLDCSSNQISALDVSGSVNLTTLYCNNNQINQVNANTIVAGLASHTITNGTLNIQNIDVVFPTSSPDNVNWIYLRDVLLWSITPQEVV